MRSLSALYRFLHKTVSSDLTDSLSRCSLSSSFVAIYFFQRVLKGAFKDLQRPFKAFAHFYTQIPIFAILGVKIHFIKVHI
ncbi:hypothetical protein AT248_03140 [Bartonella henselae]|nr:hypothetical protein BhenCHDE101_07785 [Bartonella henselae]OLL47825.1 hypothetical protein AT242_05035 [Bartonella henselae]OLL50724.1 hypothetical protein AT243_00410 [Bartonella henselae]OLL57083.1 hypothetical protein AT248_03140 [Bartonella henselae]PNM39040.1 hypothetical protein AL470_007120 [Bartonella henselae str. Houston-1]